MKKTKNTIRAALYLRAMSQQEKKEPAFVAQRNACQDFCNAQGMTLEESRIYRDITSGNLLDDRPALNALMEAARRKEFDVVVVYRLERLGRNTQLVLAVIRELERYGIGFCSATEPIDSSTPMGAATLTMLASMSEMQREYSARVGGCRCNE